MTKQKKRVVNPNNYDAKRQAAFAKLRADRIKAEEDARKEAEKTPEQQEEEAAALEGLAEAVKPEAKAS